MRPKRPDPVMYIRFQKALQVVAFPPLVHSKAVDDAPQNIATRSRTPSILHEDGTRGPWNNQRVAEDDLAEAQIESQRGQNKKDDEQKIESCVAASRSTSRERGMD